MRWTDRRITPLHLPFGPDNFTFLVRLDVQTSRIANKLELVTEQIWQAASLTRLGRREIPLAFERGWRVRQSAGADPCALILRLSAPWLRGVISTSPERIVLTQTHGLLLITPAFVMPLQGASTASAYGHLGDWLAGTRPLTVRELRKLRPPPEDLDALGALIP